MPTQGFFAITPSFARGDINQDELGVEGGFQQKWFFRINPGLVGTIEGKAIDHELTVGKIYEDSSSGGIIKFQLICRIQLPAVDRRIGMERENALVKAMPRYVVKIERS